MKKTQETIKFRELSVEELRKELRSKEEELMKLNFRHASGQLQQHSNLGLMRKSIARAQTILAEKAISEDADAASKA